MTETQIIQGHRMLIDAIINDYHTTRLDSDYVSHILSKVRTQDAFARFERDILATRTDATPVAEPRTIYVQFSDNGNIRKWAWSEFDLAEKLKVETTPVSDTPFAWAYHYTQKHPGQTKPGAMDIKRDRHNSPIAAGWTETPLYTHPPATDVAALVEAAKDLRDALAHMAAPARVDPDKYFSEQVKAFGDAFGYGALMTTASALWRQNLGDLQGGEFAVGPCVTTAANQLKRLSAALAPFTKGQP